MEQTTKSEPLHTKYYVIHRASQNILQHNVYILQYERHFE